MEKEAISQGPLIRSSFCVNIFFGQIVKYVQNSVMKSVKWYILHICNRDIVQIQFAILYRISIEMLPKF